MGKKQIDQTTNTLIVPMIIVVIGVIIGAFIIYQDLKNGPVNSGTPSSGIKETLVGYANDAGMDIITFQECLDTGKYTDVVAEDYKTALQLSVTGTPAFFINGEPVNGAQPFSVFQEKIEAALADPESNPDAVGPGFAELKGNPDAKVHIVEFTDYDCPFCERYVVETLPQIMSQYVEKGLVKYSQRHMPLEQLHPNAPLEAEATFCANEQGKFWEYHDILFAEYDARNNY